MSILAKIFKKKPSALTVYKAVKTQLEALLIASKVVRGLSDYEVHEIDYLLRRIDSLIEQREK